MDKVVCIIGPSCAGKTTVCDFLKEKLPCIVYEASSIPRRRYYESSCEISLLEFVISEFRSRGMSTFAEELFQRIKEEKDKSQLIIIDGFRACEEIDLFSKNFDKVEVFGIYANSKIRYERYKQRLRDFPVLAYKKFIEKDMMEFDFGIARMLRDYVKEIIINEGTMGSLKRRVNLLSKEL